MQSIRRLAVPHLTLGLVICQIAAYFLIHFMETRPGQEAFAERYYLIPNRVLEGEVWRLVSFLAIPPFTNIIFAGFFWYLFYLMGSSLETNWGVFRYNVYLLIGYLATVAAAFLTPEFPSANGYLQASVFLAFAFLFPDFTLYIFFLLPVKIKWLALLTWIGYFLSVVLGDWPTRFLVLASVLNFLLFFGKELFHRIRSGRRRMALQVQHITEEQREFFHRCTSCGITDRTHPQMDFRYCSQCHGTFAYCTEHLRQHTHKNV